MNSLNNWLNGWWSAAPGGASEIRSTLQILVWMKGYEAKQKAKRPHCGYFVWLLLLLSFFLFFFFFFFFLRTTWLLTFGRPVGAADEFPWKNSSTPPRPGHLIRWPDLIFFSLFLRLSVAVLDLFFPTHVTIDTTTTRKKGATWFLFWPMSTPPTPTNQQILADDCRPDRLSNKPTEAILVGLRS